MIRKEFIFSSIKEKRQEETQINIDLNREKIQVLEQANKIHAKELQAVPVKSEPKHFPKLIHQIIAYILFALIFSIIKIPISTTEISNISLKLSSIFISNPPYIKGLFKQKRNLVLFFSSIGLILFVAFILPILGINDTSLSTPISVGLSILSSFAPHFSKGAKQANLESYSKHKIALQKNSIMIEELKRTNADIQIECDEKLLESDRIKIDIQASQKQPNAIVENIITYQK